MRIVTSLVLGIAVAGAAVLAASRPQAALADPQDRVVGPVVGEVTSFRDKSRAYGNGIYQNLGAKMMCVTVVFESGTDEALLYLLKDASSKGVLQARTQAGTMDRQRCLTIDVAPGSTLWLKSEGGTARWQVVGAVPAQ